MRKLCKFYFTKLSCVYIDLWLLAHSQSYLIYLFNFKLREKCKEQKTSYSDSPFNILLPLSFSPPPHTHTYYVFFWTIWEEVHTCFSSQYFNVMFKKKKGVFLHKHKGYQTQENPPSSTESNLGSQIAFGCLFRFILSGIVPKPFFHDINNFWRKKLFYKMFSKLGWSDVLYS